MLAWRIPILSKYEYIFYVDSSFAIGNKDLYNSLLHKIGSYSFWFIAHPFNKNGIRGETGQGRYFIDDVDGQVDLYLQEKYPDSADRMLISGAFMYHAWDKSVRKRH